MEATIETLLRAIADVAQESANEIHELDELDLDVTSDANGDNPTVLGVPVMAGWRVFLLNYL